MPWVCIQVDNECVWCGDPIMRISPKLKPPDLCKPCGRIRASRKKGGDGICRGGCGCTVHWQSLRCTSCVKADRWMREPKDRNQSTRKPRGKNLKTALRYHHEMGIPIPWEDKPEEGTWG